MTVAATATSNSHVRLMVLSCRADSLWVKKGGDLHHGWRHFDDEVKCVGHVGPQIRCSVDSRALRARKRGIHHGYSLGGLVQR